MSSQSLFRQEALDAQKRSFWGKSLVFQPWPITVTTIITVLILVAIAAFLVLGKYARRETASGWLLPADGLVIMYPPRPGVITNLAVVEGARVEQGASLLSINGVQTTATGYELDETVLEAIDRQRQELNTQLQQQYDRKEIDLTKVKRDIDGLRTERETLAQRIQNQHELIGLSTERYEAVSLLNKTQDVAGIEVSERKSQLIGLKQAMSDLEQRQLSISNELDTLQQRLVDIPLEVEERASRLKAQIAQMDRDRAETDARKAINLRAPITGTVTSLRIVSGDAAKPGTPLLTILPENSLLEAELLVPTRAIGFITTGQTVRLRYDAFPYQRFGAFEGRIKAIDRAVISPRDAGLPVVIKEPVYRVKAELSAQEVNAYGEAFPLQPGMQFKADIVLEKRSIIDWLLDPINAIRNR